jgi:hypothetical protein
MNARTLASSRLTAVLTILGSMIRINPAHAGGGFLWLPFSDGTRTPGDCRGNCSATGVCIYCRWLDCVDGTVYRHFATDYGCTSNSTEVRVAADGEVIHVRGNIPRNTFPPGGAYGNLVKIRHSTGHETWYAHLLPGTITVQRGQRIVAGQLLGRSDNTGKSTAPHLHFEVRDARGRQVNPYGDPPDYASGCGPNALWVTCPPTPAPPPDVDGDGYTVAAGDCDDTNPAMRPGQEERCNFFDDDCDGTPDDPWRTGLSTDIGEPCSIFWDTCRGSTSGVWDCAPGGLSTVCYAPIPSGTSAEPEMCNGLDDDCSGIADDPWRTGLSTDLGEPCSINWSSGTCTGPTTEGAWVCTRDGLAVVCNAPNPEACNWTDDDCNGNIDDIPREYLQGDPRNCGWCWNVCASGVCVGGVCAD